METFDSISEIEDKGTNEEAKIINAINKDTVHKICSGQVILNLATAVKELVENSLDSGATNIEIRLKEYGEELVEVLDNGCGVGEDNFAGLTLKYHTSKLRDFSDLLGVTTFGFRGEALSSLCSLANMTITTRHTTAEIGTKLVYDHKGVIISRSPCARQPGTTVSLSNLFSSLPVRQKEFHRNLKREFNKMTQLLYAYCLVAEGVKIICTNQANKGQKTVVVATQGGSVQDNIACVFGIKQAQVLLELNPIYPEFYVENVKETFFNNLENNKLGIIKNEEEINGSTDIFSLKSDNELELSEESNDARDAQSCTQKSVVDSSDSAISSQSSTRNAKKPFHFHGYISSCAHGSGRSSKDRQFFYVNSRPCEPCKVMKLTNEIYKSYNPHQAPFIYLNLKMKRSSVDINVTPDKRKLFFDREKHLLEVIKTSLNTMYEKIQSTVKFENTKSEMKPALNSSLNTPRIFTSFLSQFSNDRSLTSNSLNKTTNQPALDSKRKATSTLDNYISKISKVSNESFMKDTFEYEKSQLNDCEEINPNDIKQTTNYEMHVEVDNRHDKKKDHRYSEMNDKMIDHEYSGMDDKIDHEYSEMDDKIDHEYSEMYDKVDHQYSEMDDKMEHEYSEMDDKKTHKHYETGVKVELECETKASKSTKNAVLDSREAVYLGFSDDVSLSQVVDIQDVISEPVKTKPKNSETVKPFNKKKTVVIDSEFEKMNVEKKVVKVDVTLDEIKSQMFESYRLSTEYKQNLNKVKFRNKINPVNNKECEEELRKEISKEMFSQMKIVGQFNLGFIITQLEHDLFIIDQHATDEKYNFETLQKTTVLTNQKLVVPQSLELTSLNEKVLKDNLEVFRLNGFTFQIDENARPTKKVKLVTIPTSKGTLFGKEDVDELLFMLQECPKEVCRPSRVRSMFASRACRKSVMIGTALSKSDMRRLVDHMGIIEQPWNCPHGRPTMRHLVNMALTTTLE